MNHFVESGAEPEVPENSSDHNKFRVPPTLGEPVGFGTAVEVDVGVGVGVGVGEATPVKVTVACPPNGADDQAGPTRI